VGVVGGTTGALVGGGLPTEQLLMGSSEGSAGISQEQVRATVPSTKDIVSRSLAQCKDPSPLTKPQYGHSTLLDSAVLQKQGNSSALPHRVGK
jgi:hypothetical protein